jgi:hypothetical protein
VHKTAQLPIAINETYGDRRHTAGLCTLAMIQVMFSKVRSINQDLSEDEGEPSLSNAYCLP